MSWSTISQLIRIVAYSAGALVLGQGVADGELFQQAIGGLINIGAFAGWAVTEYNKPAAAK
jgi:hypothetical protein